MVPDSLQIPPGAMAISFLMEKDITGLKKKVKALESKTGKLWVDKVRCDMADVQEIHNEALDRR